MELNYLHPLKISITKDQSPTRGGATRAAPCRRLVLSRLFWLQCNDIFDPTHFAEKDIVSLFERIATCDEGAQGVGPALHKDAQVAYGECECIRSGVNRAKDQLIFAHQSAHT